MKVERFNKTIRDKINLYLYSKKTKKYIDVLQDLVYNYNNTLHSKIGMNPIDA